MISNRDNGNDCEDLCMRKSARNGWQDNLIELFSQAPATTFGCPCTKKLHCRHFCTSKLRTIDPCNTPLLLDPTQRLVYQLNCALHIVHTIAIFLAIWRNLYICTKYYPKYYSCTSKVELTIDQLHSQLNLFVCSPSYQSCSQHWFLLRICARINTNVLLSVLCTFEPFFVVHIRLPDNLYSKTPESLLVIRIVLQI